MTAETHKQRVTVVDVAKHAGVSRSTVSLVLRSSPLVADITRERVQESIRSLGYVYNRSAAELRTQRSHTVGLVITDIANPFFAELTVGVETALDRHGYVSLLANTSDTSTKQARLLASIQEHRVDGVLLCQRGTTSDALVQLGRQLPLVLFVRSLRGLEMDYVGADNVARAEESVEHLIAHGHRRIAFIGGSEDSSARRERRQGYLNALNKHGLHVDNRLLVTSLVTRLGGHQAILELLAQPDPPTAALCYNDVVAFGVMLGLQSVGRSPGEDFAVVGFDDVAEASLWRPALTTVAIHARQIGEIAAERLLERIVRPHLPPSAIMLPSKLIVRESCGTH